MHLVIEYIKNRLKTIAILPPDAACRAMNGTPITPRMIALDLLAAVLKHHRPLDEALAQSQDLAIQDVRDRAFVRNLTATTLRRLGQIDDAIGRCLERPLPRRAIGVRDVLRLGACQLLFLNTPAHAAVDTAVTTAANRGLGDYKKLINAVLRRLSKEGQRFLADQDAGRLNTPQWLWESWTAAYGIETCRRIAEAHLFEPPLDITVKADPEKWAGLLNAEILATGSLRLTAGGSVTAMPGFDEGAWWVQDAAAALPVKLLGDIRGRHVIDIGAAPGGKTAQLLNAGAQVTAVERSEKRTTRLLGNLARLGLRAETVVADAGAWSPEAPADAVLLDAPCSSSGTIRRHPDVARLKTPEDIGKLASAQERLLDAAIGMVAPGGMIIYCTCSLQPEEGPERIGKLIGSGAPVVREPLSASDVGGLEELLSAEGDLRSLPCHMGGQGGMDGFYASRLIRQ